MNDLDQDVNFLFDEQVIQDERLLSLEEDTDTIEQQLFTIYGELDGELALVEKYCLLLLKVMITSLSPFILSNTELQDTTLALDFRVTILEENGGSDGNSSVAELEVRVETLEGTTADHETRISATESDLTGSLRISLSLIIFI